jgi:beta-glucanase (GH16 family)
MRCTPYFAASALVAFASAQTFTECNPTEKECPNDPAMAATFDTDFKAGAESVKGWKQTAGSLTYSGEGAQFTINKKGEAPTIQSEGYLHFGYVEVKAKAAKGQGIISSIVLQSEDLDEVDWEFLGTVSNTVQMNYFGKGNTTTYDRMTEAPVADVQDQMHTYALDWTAERIVFLIDGVAVRTLAYADANGGKNYPQTPSTVRIGIWAGGDPDNQPGVIEWAGGKTDYSKAPFTMTVESVKVKNYSPGKEYKWTDKSGSWQSIEVIGKGDVEGAPENSIPISPSATATATAGGLASGIDVPDVPTGTLAIPTNSAGYPIGTGRAPIGTGVGPQPSTTCTEQPPYPTAGGQNGTLPQTSSSCSCGGVATEIITGQPPVQVPTTFSTIASPVETPSYGTDIPPIEAPSYGSDITPPVETPSSGSDISPPVETVSPAPESPPYPTGGIETDTKPSPSATGVYGAPSGTGAVLSPTPSQFLGAATSNKAGAFAVLVAAAAFLV